MLWVLAALAFAQASTPPLEPTEPWTLSSQDDGCTVGRAFGDSQAIQIGFQTTMQSRPAILLARAAKKLLPAGIGELPLTIDGSEPVMVHYGSYDTSEAAVRLLKMFPDESTMTQIAKATQIRIGTKLPILNVVGTALAIKAVDDCTSKKLASWGVDPELYFQSKTASFTGNFAALFGDQNYPKEARDKGVSGRVVLLLKTDEVGTVTECKVVVSPDQSLDAGTCAVARRGRLKPPINSAGQPIASFAVIPVIWARP